MKKILILTLFVLTALTSSAQYTIYPVPQSQQGKEGRFCLSKTMNVYCDGDIDQATRNRIQQVITDAGCICKFVKKPSQKNTAITLMVNPDAFTQNGKFDRHTLSISENGISIVGEHTNAVFFALASLEQILEQQKDGALPCVDINDYADQKNRGVVEGYYGFPYSVAVKKDLMRYMMRFKMNTYMYGGKSDPFHSQYWQQAYPESITAEEERNGWMTQNQIRDIAKVSVATKVNFIWAIHPGNNFLGSETAISDIMSKYEKMHSLGIRQFALFVDDVSIPETKEDISLNTQRVSELQKAIEAKWNRKGVASTDTVRPLHFVPQIYCSGFANDQLRKDFMQSLGKIQQHITVYTTGQWVWTVPNCEHTANVREEFGREMAWWWNYPCNDNADGQIYTMDMYSNFVDMPAVNNTAVLPKQLTNNIGIVSNPMQQGEISKTPLFSVADYAWNNNAFDNKKSWEASFATITKDVAVQKAYRFITDYLRWNDTKTIGRLINNYRKELDNGYLPNSDKLLELLNEIKDNCETVETLGRSDCESDRLLYKDLSPWVLKLKADCNAAVLLMGAVDRYLNYKTDENDCNKTLEAIRDLEFNKEYTAVALEGMGNSITTSERQTQVAQSNLEPFIDYLLRKVFVNCK